MMISINQTKLVHTNFSDSVNLSIDVLIIHAFTSLACTKFSD